MKILRFLTRSSLRACSTKFNHQLSSSNQWNGRSAFLKQQPQQIITNRRSFCASANEIVLNPRFDQLLDKDEFEQIREIIRNCDTTVENWRTKTLYEMAGIYLNQKYEFGNLSQDYIEILLKDYALLKEKKVATPNRLNDEMIADLAKLWTDDKSRIHFLGHHGIKQYKRFRDICNKQLKSSFRNSVVGEKKSESEFRYSVYFKRNKSNFHQHLKMMNAVFEGQNLVLDFSFVDQCLNSEHNSIVSQTRRIISANLDAERPYNLWFTSFDETNQVRKKMENAKLVEPNHFINKKSEHFTELFAKDKLVYLSPDAEEEFDEYDHQAVYVLGAIVDRYLDDPLTFDCAKKHNIRSVRLPLDKHVMLSDLSIDLSFYSVFQMLHFMQFDYATWDKAFKCFLQPDRKVDEMELIDKFNPQLRIFSEQEVARYQKRAQHQYKHRIFHKMKN